MGFTDLTELHNEWLRSFLFNHEDQTLQAHRGSYKTTCLALAIALSLGIRPYEDIIMFRKTDMDTVEIIKQVRNILSSAAMNQIIEAYTGKTLEIVRGTSTVIDTSFHPSLKGNPQLRGFGISASVTGKHADLVITDDIVNVSDRVSRAEREKTKLAYMELQNIKNRGGRIINTGTPWHKDDAFTLMPNIRKFDCYQTGLMTKEQREDIRRKMSASLFAANYELKHIAAENVLFTEPQMDAPRAMAEQGTSHVDAAFYGEDYTAFTTGAVHDNNFYVYGRIWRKHVDDCIDTILGLHKSFKAGKMYMEMNADKGYVAREFRGRGLTVGTYHEHQNKYLKISSHLKFEWPNVVFVEGTDPEYINQILDYTEDAEHDDAPDSLASWIRNAAKHRNDSTEGLFMY
jgi:hypothetical protein